MLLKNKYTAMKKVLNYIISMVVLMGLSTSCLDLNPISEIGEESFYKNQEEMNLAVIACYNGLHGTISKEWALTEVRSDNARLYNAATSSATNLLLVQLDQLLVSPNNSNVEEYWNAVYHNISRCNTVLRPDYLAVVTDPVKHDQFKGEALFIRSYHYFNMVRLFGPVFLITDNISAQEAKTKDRIAVDEVYEQIEKDLLEAIDLLPSSYDDNDKGRVTSFAARALYGKLLLTLHRNTEASTVLGNLLTDYGTDLIAFDQVFDIGNELNKDILFAIRFLSGDKGLGSPFGNYFAPKNSGLNVINGDGDGFNHPTTELINLFASDDVRKTATLSETYYDPGKTEPNIYDPYVTKYLSSTSSKYDSENDWPVLRLSDCILMYAEVLNELNGPSAGLEYLNMVRTRAGLVNYNISDFPHKQAFRNAIEKERRLELAFENERWFDLLRWDIAVDRINNHLLTEAFYSEYTYPIAQVQKWQLLLPIPQNVIDINPTITQNFGY